MRQTWEEIGIDLAERDYISIGQLDDREITTSLGKRLLMILSPFVFLQVTPQAPPPDPVPTTTLYWTPLASLVSPISRPKWSTVTVDAASRLAPKHSTALRLLVRLLVGSMEFPAILVEPSSSLHPTPTADAEPNLAQNVLEKGISAHPTPAFPATPQKLKLWGLSLGMTLDLMSYMILPIPTSNSNNANANDSASSSPLSTVMHLPYQSGGEGMRMEVVAPSLASVFPRFSYPDVNFWIWCVGISTIKVDCILDVIFLCRVFGKRYREVVRGWEASVRAGGTNDRRYAPSLSFCFQSTHNHPFCPE